jgi:squalene-hopene/tetraprenyl-beta-curcumene cyclase
VHEAAKAPTVAYLASWSPSAAAKYLDEREVWWQYWEPAKRDHGTICVSCHTNVPYALSRSALGGQLGEQGAPEPEQVMLDSIDKRVANWTEMAPFYSDAGYGAGKAAQSRSTESVINAVILASYDAQQGKLRPITKQAFGEAWALQEKSGPDAGGWLWQDFRLVPWETKSGYQGAAMLAIALGNAPEDYVNDPAIRTNVALLENYLKHGYADQSLMSRVYVLWASARMPGLLTATQRAELIDQLRKLQQQDGGWILDSLDKQPFWRLLMGTSQSDGCATGLVMIALEVSGISGDDPMVQHGLAWLQQHQSTDGSWRAYSLNEPRDPNSNIGRFMSDAATGYAVLALELARKDGGRQALIAGGNR